MKRKRDLKLEFTARYLTNDEADQVRELAISLKPKVHLIKSDWPYCEIRGIRDEAAAQLVDALNALPGVRIKTLS